MLIKRFSEEDNSKSFKDKAMEKLTTMKNSVVNAGKFVRDYHKEHGTHETIRAGVRASGNYIKKHPDEAAVMVGSYTVLPWMTNKILTKAVKNPKLRTSIAGATALLPVGSAYIAWKAARRAKKQEQQNNKN